MGRLWWFEWKGGDGLKEKGVGVCGAMLWVWGVKLFGRERGVG